MSHKLDIVYFWSTFRYKILNIIYRPRRRRVPEFVLDIGTKDQTMVHKSSLSIQVVNNSRIHEP